MLFVDDEAMLIELGKATLEALGYRVTATGSPLEALELFRRDPAAYDLVITDQSMPEISGAQLTTALLQIRPDIPIVMYTGYSESIDANRAIALGIKAFLQKPVDQRHLSRTLREVLGDRFAENG